MADYPAAVKNFLTLQDGVDSVIAAHPNDRGGEITAIETLLGPMGAAQTHNESLKNLLLAYRKGCRVKASGDAEIKVETGEIAIPNASNNVKWRRNTSETTVNWSDIDTGAEDTSKRYYVHAIADSSGTTFDVVISLSPTAPNGITFFRLIGSFFNDSGDDITDVMDDDILFGKTPGEVTAWTTDNAPAGAILCNGAAQDASGDETLDDLFAEIGSVFGGSDETDFQVPDIRGRTIIGLDDMGGSSANRVTAAAADSIGGASGAETHTLSIAELSAHTHPVFGRTNTSIGSATRFAIADTDTGNQKDVATGSTGGGSAHNIMSPYMALAHIIWK